ncbi:MAG TPA: dienelactone hydrolase family protein, partial [Amphiplicatus sp.]|nr:dienelactone hydrolase family protein [Amphiplicatus sp.]
MTRKISQSIIDLYDAYTHGAMARREFMKRLAKAAGGAAAAQAIMPLLANDYARAAIIAEDDPRLAVSSESFETGDIVDLADPSSFTGDIGHAVEAYVARPKDAEAAPAIIVIHENRGLNPHIKDVARRVALEGFT